VAQTGREILFFSLEMSRFELMAKSISRISLELEYQVIKVRKYSKSAQELMDSKKKKDFCLQENSLLDQAKIFYSQFAEHIFIFEGQGDIGISDIYLAVEKY
jgi:replicative DNA helicase